MSSRQGFEIFKSFENKEYIEEDEIKSLSNYVCGNFTGYYCPNYHYYYDCYGEVGDLYHVCRWRKNNNEIPRARGGERVCYLKIESGEIIDLTLEENKKHYLVCYRWNRNKVF